MAEGKPRPISSTDFKEHYGAVLDTVSNEKRVVVVTAHGRPQVAIIPIDEYEALMERLPSPARHRHGAQGGLTDGNDSDWHDHRHR